MPHVIVTLDYNQKTKKDLALPLDVPSRLLAGAIAQGLNIKRPSGQSFALVMQTRDGIRRIPSGAWLGEAGALHGTRLSLLLEERQSVRPLTQRGAFLKAENGKVFPIAIPKAAIGRRDTKRNLTPDVDLTEMDAGKITSRHHAEIDCRNGFSITDVGSNNGTWLNGERLVPNRPYDLKRGMGSFLAAKG